MKKRIKKNNSTRKKNKNPIIYNDSDILPKVSLAVERCFKEDEEEGDRISELPDDILVSILSLLTFREATATKILSSRWGRLDPVANVVSHAFPFPLERRESFFGGCIQSARDQDTISDYIGQVNHALDSYKGGLSIDKFKIDIHCVTNSRLAGGHCEKWLEFALSRETEIIDIRTIYDSNYTSSNDIIPQIRVDSILLKHGNSLPGLKCLKKLSLSGVYFYDFEDQLPKLVVLERLSIESPQTLFMDIEVCHCVNVKCHGLELYYLHINRAPKLVDINIVNAQSGIDGRIIPDQFDIYGRHLLRVRLYFRLLDRESGNRRSYMPPTLTKVKHMVLDIEIDEECSNYQLFPLIQTCPYMEKLEIKFLWSSKVTYKYRRLDKDLIERKVAINKLQTLRLSGYRGTVSELEFILYVVNNATELKDLIIVEPPQKNCVIRPRFITRAFKHL